jgi:GT2 family glycosyltransferase
MQPEVSVVMTIFNRADLLEITLRKYAQYPDSKRAELIVVDDQSTDHVAEVLKTWGAKVFGSVRHVFMDKRKSIIPVYHNNPALGVNIGVRHARAEIVMKTDPECYPCGNLVGKAIELFKKDALLFAEIHRGNKELNGNFKAWYDRNPGKNPPDNAHEINHEVGPGWEALYWSRAAVTELPYWFTALFSRSLFEKIGGVDERFLEGFAGEDDEWAERMARNGAPYRWVAGFTVIHLWHPLPQDRRNPSHPQYDPKFDERHERNKNLIWESRQLNKLTANAGHRWGYANCGGWVYEEGKTPLEIEMKTGAGE